jgi:capsule polysaccharide modification protein KpsS
MLTVCNFSFLSTIHNGFVFVDSNISDSVTIQNYTHVHTNTFSHNDRYHHQNIDLSSWITLYTAVFVCTQEQKVRESSGAISVALLSAGNLSPVIGSAV